MELEIFQQELKLLWKEKKNEDEEEGQEKMYTLVKLAPMFQSE